MARPWGALLPQPGLWHSSRGLGSSPALGAVGQLAHTERTGLSPNRGPSALRAPTREGRAERGAWGGSDGRRWELRCPGPTPAEPRRGGCPVARGWRCRGTAEQKVEMRERSAARPCLMCTVYCFIFNFACRNDKAEETPGRGAGCPAGRGGSPGGRSAAAEPCVYRAGGGWGQNGERARPDGAGRAAAPGR